jgi:hypothetical protein
MRAFCYLATSLDLSETDFGSAGNFPNGGYKFPARTQSEGRGNRGYWIFPTLKALQPEITRRWKARCGRKGITRIGASNNG